MRPALRNVATSSLESYISDTMPQRAKTPLIRVLHLFTLFTFALAQPLYDLLGRYPEFLIAHGAGAIDLVSILLVVSVLIPGLAILVWLLIGRLAPGYHRAVYLFALFALVALILLPPVKMLPDWLHGFRAAAALLAGVAFAWSYSRVRTVRSFVTLLPPAIILSPALFLVQSPLPVGGPQDHSARFPEKIDGNTPVILVVFDEFPVTSLMNEDREIDAGRYPNFDRLARRATWYRNATSVADNTTRSLPALLTGNYPRDGAVPLASDYPDNLLALLKVGYRLNIFESASRLSPQPTPDGPSRLTRQALLFSDLGLIYLHVLSPQKLARTVLPPIQHTWRDFGNPADWMHQRWLRALRRDRRQEWFDFLAKIPPGDESDPPSLNFAHVLLPHSPFQYLPSGSRYTLDPGASALATGIWEDDHEVARSYYRHLLQVGFVDHLIGALIDRLESMRLFEPALVIVTADHGISFRAGDRPRSLTATNVWDVISVPLFIKPPFQRRGRIDDTEVQLIDVLPTVAPILGVRLPWATDGRNLQSVSAEPRETRVYSDSDSEGLLRFRDESDGYFLFPSDSEAKYASLRVKSDLFGGGAGPDGFFYPLHAQPFVGRRISEFQIMDAPDATVGLDQEGTLGSTLSRRNFLKTRLSGSLRLPDGAVPGSRVLVAIDDVFRAVAVVEAEGRFSTVLPESAFSEERFELRLFLVDDGPRLLELDTG